MENRVVVDSDFCNMLVNGENIEKGKDFIRSIFDSLQKKPALHSFVFHQELFINEAIKDLVAEKYIEIIDYNDFLTEEIFKMQYIETFVELFYFMNGEIIPNKFESITKHRAKKNMGEIHSLLLAQYMNIPIFMSNDKGAKNLAKNKINTQSFAITVKDVCDVFIDIKKSGIKQIDTQIVRSILKKRNEWPEKYKNAIKKFC